MSRDVPRNDHGPSFEILRPKGPRGPVVVSSPHSGRAYPAAFVAGARLDRDALRRSEDCFVDELFAAAPEHGAPLLRALFPRAYVDPNRAPFELDPTMFDDPLPAFVETDTPHVYGGLGTVPRLVASGAEIHAGKLRFAEAEARIRACHRPYHAALAGLIEETRRRFGFVFLLDCHSMPSTDPGIGSETGDGGRARRLDIVLGDRHGAACHGAIVDRAEAVLAARGLAVRRNAPYAGGYITRHYGRPETGAHALQIEINRALYMDEDRYERTAGFARIAADMTALVAALTALGTSALAAE